MESSFSNSKENIIDFGIGILVYILSEIIYWMIIFFSFLILDKDTNQFGGELGGLAFFYYIIIASIILFILQTGLAVYFIVFRKKSYISLSIFLSIIIGFTAIYLIWTRILPFS